MESSFAYTTTPNFLTRENMSLGKVKIFFLFAYYPAKPGFLGSIEFTGLVNFFCISGCAQTFTAKRLRYLNFLTVFRTSLDNYSAKLDIIGLFDTICCWKLCNFLRPVFFLKNI